jgi:carbon storage regulator CsrA
MLVLSRKVKEQICIGRFITITVIRTKGNSVHLGIEAPHHVRIKRAELGPLEFADTVEPAAELEPNRLVDAQESTRTIRIDSRCPSRQSPSSTNLDDHTDRRCHTDRWSVSSMRERVRRACRDRRTNDSPADRVDD